MTDWTAQLHDGVEQWLKAQREWYEATLPRGGAEAAGPDGQERAIEAWREAARGVLDAQAEVLGAAVREQSRQNADALLRRWTDAQREMWQGWLGILDQGGGAVGAGGGASDAGRQMVESLRRAAEQLVQSQADWAKAWSASAEGGAKPDARGGP